MTQIIKINENDIKNQDIEKLKKCAESLKKGNLVIFPTETVYGIGASALDEKAAKKIFIAKGRPNDNPLIVHVSSIQMINDICYDINNIEQKIIDTFFPGPITLILKRKNIIPDYVTASLDTVGIRMPENKIAQKLIELANIPVAAPSANISGKPSGTLIDDIIDEFDTKVDYIIDGGISKIGVESTVVKVIDNVVNILRPGKISPEDFEKAGFLVKLDKNTFKSVETVEKVESPGMKYRHYAPKAKTILVESGNDIQKVKLIKEDLKKYNGKIAVMGFKEHEKYFKDINVEFLNIGSVNDLLEISKNIFTTLRKIDKDNIDICYIEGVEKKGIGIAIMNRLIRASGGNII